MKGSQEAPLTEEETQILKEIYSKVKPFLRKEGIEAIEKQGTHVVSKQNEIETPLVHGKECAYISFSDLPKGNTGRRIAGCGIEDAYNARVISFKKPISCHLYPVRIQEYSEFAAVNYHKWSICSDACSLGKELSVPVYKFVRDALIRKFWQQWYSELEKVKYSM